MAAGRIVLNCMPAIDRNGDPVEGALLYFYENETTTLKAVYADFGLTTPLSNPVVADSAAQFPSIFADQEELYSAVCFSPSGTQLPDSAYTFVQASQSVTDISGGVTLPLDTGETVNTSSGTGATARTGQSKLGDVVNVKDFGAVANGTDQTAAFLKACVYLTSIGGGTINFRGTYGITSLTLPQNVNLKGDGPDASIIRALNATGEVIRTTSVNQVSDCSFTNAVTRTSGSYLCLDGVRLRASNLYMSGYYRGISVADYASSADVNITECQLRDGATTGGSGGIMIGRNFLAIETGLHRVIMDAPVGSQPGFGIKIQYADATVIDACDIIHHGFDLEIAPANGQTCTSFKALGTYFDSAGSGIVIDPVTGGNVQFVQFIGCWTSSHSGVGTILSTAVGGAIDGVEFIGHQTALNASHGMTADSGVKNLKIIGGKAIKNTGSGILLSAGITDVQISNLTAGDSDLQTGNTRYGIELLAGVSNWLDISNNDLRGNTLGSLLNGATGVNNRIQANKGYNPVGGSAITVGASPFVYTAGPSGETVYIAGGTVSGIAVAGFTAFNTVPATIELGPNETVTVTYTVAPFMNKSVH